MARIKDVEKYIQDIRDGGLPHLVEIHSLSDYSGIKKIWSASVEVQKLMNEDDSYYWEINSDYLADYIDKQAAEIDKFESSFGTFDIERVSKNVDILLKKSKIKISDLEALLDVSAGYISRGLNPDSNKRLSIDIVWKMAELFRVTVDDLLNRDFSAPSIDLGKVELFLEKLIDDSDNGNIKWTNTLKFCNTSNACLFSKDEADGEWIYMPEDETVPVDVRNVVGNIFVARVQNRSLFIVPVETGLSKTLNFDVFAVGDPREGEDWKEYITCLYKTKNDASRTLYVKTKELYSAIMSHENDFKITDSAESFMDLVLSDDGLPFA